MDARRYQIGELARISGVAAKTIRFYSDSGILPPTMTTAAGYRLYSEADRGRLETIRALRELGFPLATIATLLDQGEQGGQGEQGRQGEGAVATALRAQLAALAATERTIRRQRVVLRAALRRGEAATLAYFDHAHAHARLGAIERQTLLDDYLTRVFDGVAADDDWQAGFAQAAILELPDELSDAQFAAWLELADLITDAEFVARLNAIGRAASPAATRRSLRRRQRGPARQPHPRRRGRAWRDRRLSGARTRPRRSSLAWGRIGRHRAQRRAARRALLGTARRPQGLAPVADPGRAPLVGGGIAAARRSGSPHRAIATFDRCPTSRHDRRPVIIYHQTTIEASDVRIGAPRL